MYDGINEVVSNREMVDLCVMAFHVSSALRSDRRQLLTEEEKKLQRNWACSDLKNVFLALKELKYTIHSVPDRCSLCL